MDGKKKLAGLVTSQGRHSFDWLNTQLWAVVNEAMLKVKDCLTLAESHHGGRSRLTFASDDWFTSQKNPHWFGLWISWNWCTLPYKACGASHMCTAHSKHKYVAWCDAPGYDYYPQQMRRRFFWHLLLVLGKGRWLQTRWWWHYWRWQKYMFSGWQNKFYSANGCLSFVSYTSQQSLVSHVSIFCFLNAHLD